MSLHDHMDHTMGPMGDTTAHHHGDMTTGHDHGSMTTGHDHNGGGGGGMDHMMMMQMTFEAGYKVTILFDEWATTSVGSLVGSCIGIFLFAILYEGLKYFRERLHRKNYVSIDYSKVKGPEANGAQVNQTKTTVSCQTSMLSSSHFIQTALHLLQLVISYFLMLIVMTYNVWVFLSVILGCTVGYFLFGWQRGFMVDITEHCH